MKQVLRGGLADRKRPSDFSPQALKQGRKVESEHTGNPRIATEIAMDHLTEDPSYYEKLKLIEKKAMYDAFDAELEKLAGPPEEHLDTLMQLRKRGQLAGAKRVEKWRRAGLPTALALPSKREKAIAHLRGLSPLLDKMKEVAKRKVVKASADPMYKFACGDMLDYFNKHPQKLKEYKERQAAKKRRKMKTAMSHYIPLIPSPAEYVDLVNLAHKIRQQKDQPKEKKATSYTPNLVALYPSSLFKSKKKEAGFMTNVGNRIRWSNTGRAAEALIRNPADALKKGVRASFRDPTTGKVGFGKGNRLMPGLFVAGTAAAGYSAMKKDNPDQIGPGRGERMGRFIGGTVTGLAATPYGGIGAGMALGMAGDAIGGRIGRIADRLRGYKAQRVPPAAQQVPQQPQAQPQQALPIQPKPQGAP